MTIFKRSDIEQDIIEDLLEEIQELYEASEQVLIELEIRPTDIELQRSLFRSIHTIKGDLGLVAFHPLVPLVSHVEDLLDLLRNGKVSYNSIMSDLVLLTMDRVKTFVEVAVQSGEVEYDEELFDLLCKQIKRITPENFSEHERLLADAVLLLDPSLDVEQDLEEDIAEDIPTVPEHIDDELKDDLLFFRAMMEPVERRSKYWKGRGDRIAKLCLFVNEIAGKPIAEEQLVAACYVHDFGMAFISHDLIHKKGKLNQQEIDIFRGHVQGSARLLKNMPKWKEALKFVMQHHERSDGSGYPLGLQENEISDGAKLLAIVDSFDALTHERAHDTHTKRPIRRAITELNADAGNLFSRAWMAQFNKAMMSLITQK
jgi:HD-GYP domain-containing protein (c-di-GMP phosphodiesterase class II)